MVAAAPKAKTSKTLVAVKRPGVRKLAAQATREGILKAAIKVFAKGGFAGGRVEKISKAAKSYDRMIYYYFGSKEGLFIEVLETIYRRMNDAEAQLAIDVSTPLLALEQVVHFVLDYYRHHPEFVTLLNTENLHKGKHIVKSLRAREFSSPAIAVIHDILRAGVSQGLFRADISARDVYLLIAATGYFYMSNRYTLSAFLGENIDAPQAVAQWKSFVIDTVFRVVNVPPPSHP
jgi:AcrR family transcriptional regulator